MPEVTFRDFAAAVMTSDTASAAAFLETLLAVDGTRAAAATAHFQQQMKEHGQNFMMKAMGLRTAVTSGSDAEMSSLLGDCFGLEGDELDGAVAALRRRYPRP